MPLLAIQWVADLKITGAPPCPLWDLPPHITDEIRVASEIVNRPRQGD